MARLRGFPTYQKSGENQSKVRLADMDTQPPNPPMQTVIMQTVIMQTVIMQDCHSDRSEAKWRNLQLFLLGSAAQIFQVPSGLQHYSDQKNPARLYL
jgi:hypothetical protein